MFRRFYHLKYISRRGIQGNYLLVLMKFLTIDIDIIYLIYLLNIFHILCKKNTSFSSSYIF